MSPGDPQHGDDPQHGGDAGGGLAGAVMADHRRSEELLSEFLTLDLEQRRLAFPYVVRTLMTHEAAEELVMYPALRRAAVGGDALARDRMEEERRAERMLSDLEHTRLDDAGFEASFRALQQWVLEHAEHEERHVLPVLRDGLGADELEELGRAYERAKHQAPTHAHPSSPHVPAMMKTAGALDRARDLVTLRNAPRLRRALRTRDLGALLRRPPWQPHHG